MSISDKSLVLAVLDVITLLKSANPPFYRFDPLDRPKQLGYSVKQAAWEQSCNWWRDDAQRALADVLALPDKALKEEVRHVVSNLTKVVYGPTVLEVMQKLIEDFTTYKKPDWLIRGAGFTFYMDKVVES